MDVMGAPALAGTRRYIHHHLDSTRWEHVDVRDGDIVVTTPYKCGTTWTQRILAAMIHGPEVVVDRHLLSPWVDARIGGQIEELRDALEVQTERRFMKSHLALDGTTWDDRITYVVVGRDLRDVFMSLVNHYSSYSATAFAVLEDGNPGEPIPRYPGDIHAFWADWISRGWFEWERDGYPFWSAFHHLETWWTARTRPNVVFVHYADLLAHPLDEVERLASALGIERTRAELQRVVKVSSFDAMKKAAIEAEAAAGGPEGSLFEGGVATFIHKGTNGRWRDVLTADELAAYEERMASLDPTLRAWLESGRRATDLP